MNTRTQFSYLLPLALGLSGLMLSPKAFAQTPAYSITDLTPHDSLSLANGLNNAGQVVGTVKNGTGTATAFLWQNDAYTAYTNAGNDIIPYAINDNGLTAGTENYTGSSQLPVRILGTTTTRIGTLTGTGSVSDINAVGQIVGAFNNQPALWQPGATSPVTPNPKPGTSTYLSGINDAGVMSGTAVVGGVNHAFIYDGVTFTDLGLGAAGATASGAGHVNNAGQVQGNSYFSTPTDYLYRAGVWQNGTYTDLGTLGGTKSSSTDINSTGQVVGFSFTTSANSDNTAFVWSAATGMRNLNTLIPAGTGWTLTNATGINDKGQIIGIGFHNAPGITSPNNYHAFLLSPVAAPEPSSLAVIGFGALTLGVSVSRRSPRKETLP